MSFRLLVVKPKSFFKRVPYMRFALPSENVYR